LMIPFVMVYEVGSEALHGTMLGATIGWGLFDLPNDTREDQEMSLLLSSAACLSAMLQIGGREAGLNDIGEASHASFWLTFGNFGKLLRNPETSEPHEGSYHANVQSEKDSDTENK